MLLGQKITKRVAEMRTLPPGIDQRSACRHPDWTGPDDLTIKIEELRELTDWEKPVFVKIGASRPRFDVQLAVKAGADVVVLDGMQGGTGATQEVFIEHAGIPTLPALRQAVEALQELGQHRKVQLIISGGIRSGADVAKALAMGADAVSIGTAALVALGCNRNVHVEDYRALGTEPGACHHCHTGRCPVGITTQDPGLESRLDVEEGARRIRNFLTVDYAGRRLTFRLFAQSPPFAHLTAVYRKFRLGRTAPLRPQVRWPFGPGARRHRSAAVAHNRRVA